MDNRCPSRKVLDDFAAIAHTVGTISMNVDGMRDSRRRVLHVQLDTKKGS
jgi:hypothetical protein